MIKCLKHRVNFVDNECPKCKEDKSIRKGITLHRDNPLLTSKYNLEEVSKKLDIKHKETVERITENLNKLTEKLKEINLKIKDKHEEKNKT